MGLPLARENAAPLLAARTGWILNRRSDLSFFILSPLYSVTLLGLFLLLTRAFHLDVAQTERTFFLWFLILFDRPHIVQTFSRTHFDGIERRRRPLLHWGLLGAALLYTAFFPEFTNHDYYRFFFALFGTWHIFAQNMGFLKLYGRKSEAPESLLSKERWAYRLFAWAYFFKVGAVDLTDPQFRLFELLFWGVNRVLLAGFLVAISLVAVEWVRAWRRGGFRWAPRVIFLLCLFLVYGANYFAMSILSPLVMNVFDTFYHDLQYLRFTAHFQQKTFHFRNVVLTWLAVGVAVSALAYHGENYLILTYHLHIPFAALFGVVTVYHYFIDGLIWKFRTQPELGKLFA